MIEHLFIQMCAYFETYYLSDISAIDKCILVLVLLQFDIYRVLCSLWVYFFVVA